MMRSAFTQLKVVSAFVLVAITILHSRVSFAEVVERIVAIVNDDIITQTDLAKYAARLKSGGLNDELLIPDEATRAAVLADHNKLLNKLIDEKILDSEVKKQNLSIPIERVEQEIRSIAKRNNISRDELKSAIQERGIEFSQYQDFIKTGLERQGLIEKAVTSKIKISEDDVLAAYLAHHPEDKNQAYEYSLAHIYFLSQRGGPEAARNRAEEAYKKLQEGGNFEKLASEYSEDPAFEAGGLLGVFKTGEVNADLEGSIAKLNAGEYTPVLSTRDGYHIVKVLKKKLITDPRTEKEREKIRAELYTKSYKKQFQSWMDQLHQDAFIRINDRAEEKPLK